MVKWATILLAIAGCALGLYTIATAGNDRPPALPPAAPPSVNPFGKGLAAGGSVEAESRNLQVAAPEPGLVVEVLAEVGQIVKKGDVLAKLDTRLLEAELVRSEAGLLVAKAELAQLVAQPRPEEIPALRAAVERAKSRLADAKDQFEEMDAARKKGAGTPTELNRRRFNAEAAQADLDQAQANLDLTLKGAWAPVVESARARVKAAEAEIQAIRLRMDRLIIHSPIDGTVLKRNIEPGQYAGVAGSMTNTGGSNASAAFVVGDTTTLRIRARVDEEDAPQLVEGAKGQARIRGVQTESVELRMIRIEPLAEPKMNLMGTTTERVDTRVIEVIFEVIGKSKLRMFPGQAVDVFIDVPPVVKAK